MKNLLKTPVLFMYASLPGSGKTYLSRQLAKEIGAVHINVEKLRTLMYPSPNYSAAESVAVKQVAFILAEEFISRGISVIYDYALLTTSSRTELRLLAKHSNAKSMLIWQQIDPNAAFDRVKTRHKSSAEDDKYQRSLSQDEFLKAAQLFEAPKHEQPIVISGRHSFKGQMQSIQRHLEEAQLLNKPTNSKKTIPNPGLINLVSAAPGRVDHTRRTISVNNDHR